MNKKLNITRNILLAGGLLSSFVFVLSLFVSNRQPSVLKLKEGEVLFVYLTTDQLFSWEHDEINWYKWDTEWFILDYKADPGTYYINNDYILTWGIER